MFWHLTCSKTTTPGRQTQKGGDFFGCYPDYWLTPWYRNPDFLTFKEASPVPTALISSLVVILTNQMDIWPAFSESFATAAQEYFGTYLIMFFLGALFGKIMGDSGAAKSIAMALMRVLGKKNAILIVVLASAVLSYGGVSLFVCVFSVYPIAMVLWKEANISKRLFPACMLFGCATFTMVATPGTPAASNIIPTSYLGTNTYAAPILGLMVTAIMFVLGYAFLLVCDKHLKLAGEGFVPGENDNVNALSLGDTSENPHWLPSILPLLLVIVIIFSTRNALPSLYSVNLALLAGIILACILYRPYLKGKSAVGILASTSESSIMALINTAVIVGFGGVVQASAGFGYVVDFALGLANLNPFIATGIAVNVVAGVTGSSSGGLTIFMDSLGAQFLELVQRAGYNPGALHRIAAIASSGLDSLPHSGATVTCIRYAGVSVKKGWPFVAGTNIVVTIISLCAGIGLAMMGIC